MTVEQVIAYVESLNMLFVNKVITRAEFRAALLATPLYGAVCQAPRAPKGKGDAVNFAQQRKCRNK